MEELLRLYEQRGGVTRRAFCESHKIPIATLGYYLRHKPVTPVRLARVKLSNGAAGESRFALILAGGRRIECGLADLPHLINAAEQG